MLLEKLVYPEPKFIQSRNFKHFNEENFLTDLKNASWPVIKSGMEVNSAWNAWKDIFLTIVDKHAPTSHVSQK